MVDGETPGFMVQVSHGLKGFGAPSAVILSPLLTDKALPSFRRCRVHGSELGG